MKTSLFGNCSMRCSTSCIHAVVIFLLLSLCSFNAVGKKLYKFQDAQGTWHFTDKPTGTESKETELNLEVRQLKAAPKQLVWLLQSGEERHPRFYIRNDYAGPVEVEIGFSPAARFKFLYASIKPGQTFKASWNSAAASCFFPSAHRTQA